MTRWEREATVYREAKEWTDHALKGTGYSGRLILYPEPVVPVAPKSRKVRPFPKGTASPSAVEWMIGRIVQAAVLAQKPNPFCTWKRRNALYREWIFNNPPHPDLLALYRLNVTCQSLLHGLGLPFRADGATFGRRADWPD